MSTDTTKTKDKKKAVVEVRKISFDGILSAKDVEVLTGLSRVTIWRLEREGRFPARVQLSCNRVGWYGNEVQDWIKSRPRVNLTTCELECANV